MIIASQNDLTLHICKTHLPIVSLNVQELKLMLKRALKEKREPITPPLRVGWKLLQSLNIY